jgi:hypothetical protein
MSTSSYLSPRSLMMRVVWAASMLIGVVFMGTPSLSKGYTQGAEVEMRWRKFDGAGSWSPCLAVASRAAAKAWSFSSAETHDVRSPWILMISLDASIFRTRYP